MEEFSINASAGKKIRARRRQLGLKLASLANEIFPLDYLREVEQGHQPPSLEFLKYIASCLDLTVSELEAETKLNARRSLKAEQELLLMNAHVAIQTNQPNKAQGYLEQVKPPRLRAGMLANYYDLWGQVKIAQRKFAEGRADLERALQLLESNAKAEPIQIERVRNWLGLSYYRQQDFAPAIEQHRQCLQAILQGRITDLRFKMKIHYNLANEYHAMGDQAQALDFYYEAARLAEEAEEFSDMAGIYWGIGMASKHSQDLKTAMIYFAKSATLYEKLGEAKYAAMVKGFLGWVLVERGEYEQAEKNLKSALATASQLEDNENIIYLHLNLSQLYLDTDCLDKAKQFATSGLDLAQKNNYPLALGQALYSLGLVNYAQDKPKEAIDLYRQAEKVLKTAEAWTYLEKVYKKWREALLATDQKIEAFEISQKAFECQEKLKLLKR